MLICIKIAEEVHFANSLLPDDGFPKKKKRIKSFSVRYKLNMLMSAVRNNNYFVFKLTSRINALAQL